MGRGRVFNVLQAEPVFLTTHRPPRAASCDLRAPENARTEISPHSRGLWQNAMHIQGLHAFTKYDGHQFFSPEQESATKMNNIFLSQLCKDVTYHFTQIPNTGTPGPEKAQESDSQCALRDHSKYTTERGTVIHPSTL